MEDYRSISKPYLKYIVKEYQYWTLMLADDQRYLGRAYVWLVREGKMQRLSRLFPQEEFELFRIMNRYEHALEELWQPDHMNYSWLGNLLTAHGGHGHMHLIPRYQLPRVFKGIQFSDGRFKKGKEKNCWPYKPFKVENELMYKIKDAILAEL